MCMQLGLPNNRSRDQGTSWEWEGAPETATDRQRQVSAWGGGPSHADSRWEVDCNKKSQGKFILNSRQSSREPCNCGETAQSRTEPIGAAFS